MLYIWPKENVNNSQHHYLNFFYFGVYIKIGTLQHIYKTLYKNTEQEMIDCALSVLKQNLA